MNQSAQIKTPPTQLALTHKHHPAARRARRKRAEEATLEGMVSRIIYPMLMNSNHLDYRDSWQDEALGLYVRLMRSARLRELHAQGLEDAVKYFVLRGVKTARLNALRAAGTQKNLNTCYLEDTFNKESFNHSLRAANHDGGVYTLEYIDALAESDERLRFEANFNVEAIDVLLEASSENRRIFLAKAFTSLSSREIGEWICQKDYIVNNRFHKMISEVRRRVRARLMGR